MCVSNIAVSKATSVRWLKLRAQHATRLSAEIHVVESTLIPTAPPPAANLATAAKSLGEALEDCLDYARRKDLKPWDKVFANALSVLREGPTTPLTDIDAVFARYFANESARLLSATAHADVFGAMGSWNDLMLEDDKGYDRVSAALFRALTPALLAACSENEGS